MSTTPALYYHPDGYETSRPNLMGRHAAGESFLRALAQYSPDDTLYCYAGQKQHFEHFVKKISTHSPTRRTCSWLDLPNWRGLEQCGGIFMPAPDISWLAWQRRHYDSRAYSISGITHTTATTRVMDDLGDLLIAPVQPWDALICTSQSVKIMVRRVLENFAAYLGDRFGVGTSLNVNLNLPVIPLGIHCAAYQTQESVQADIRARWHLKLKMEPDEFVVLFMGRLSFLEKAHPVPLYLSLERAAKLSNRKIHLVMAGWFENDANAAQFIEGAKAFCPSVRVTFVDGRQDSIRKSIWFAADVFVSLSDNVQETFGLTPIEAMASGLPVIVSDWDGYKETVRDGIDGFRIPTWMPPAGLGSELALNNAIGITRYQHHIGVQCQFTSIDVGACASAFARLASDPALCKQMGKSGQKFAEQCFDWAIVIKQYYGLWNALAELRRAAPPMSLEANIAPNPLRDEPCSLFANYPTNTISPDSIVSTSNHETIESYEKLLKFDMNTLAKDYLFTDKEFRELLKELTLNENVSVQSLCNTTPMARGRALLYSLGWLSKMGLIDLKTAEVHTANMEISQAVAN